MPATFTPELIDGTLLELSSIGASRKVVRGLVENLQVDTATPDPEVIWRAQAACTAAGYALGSPLANHTGLILQRIIIRGFTTDGCVVDLFYETPVYGFTPSTLIVRKRSFLSERSANTFVNSFGARLPIEVLARLDALADYAQISYLHPMKSIEVSGLAAGSPSNAADPYVGYVNNAIWQGLPIGYWMISQSETDISVYTGYYQFQRAALTRCTIDWGEIAILRNQNTGKFISVALADRTTIANRVYTNDLFQVPGATKVGPYKLTDFDAIFGTLP